MFGQRCPTLKAFCFHLPGTSSVSVSLRMPKLHFGGLLFFSSVDMFGQGREQELELLKVQEERSRHVEQAKNKAAGRRNIGARRMLKDYL